MFRRITISTIFNIQYEGLDENISIKNVPLHGILIHYTTFQYKFCLVVSIMKLENKVILMIFQKNDILEG